MATSHAAELAELVAAAAADLDVEAGVTGSGDGVFGRSDDGRQRRWRDRRVPAPSGRRCCGGRTPEASPSPRGPEWVAFSPTTFDRFTRDRIEAWFEFAVGRFGG